MPNLIGKRFKRGSIRRARSWRLRRASLNGTRADLERAKVDAEGPDVPLLKRAYVRAQGMAKEGVVSASALDDAQKNYEMSLNKQNVSKAQLQVLQAKIGQAQGQMAQDRANLKQLEEQLGYTTIESPLDGIVFRATWKLAMR